MEKGNGFWYNGRVVLILRYRLVGVLFRKETTVRRLIGESSRVKRQEGARANPA